MDKGEPDFTFFPIGVVRSPFPTAESISARRNMDPEGFQEIAGEIEIFPEYGRGLMDIEGFSHLIVLFVFHCSTRKNLTACPPHDHRERGVFATRSPNRPNPIGMTVVRLHGVRGNMLKVSGLDMMAGTPVLDIKPYTLRDRKLDLSLGWLEPFVRNK